MVFAVNGGRGLKVVEGHPPTAVLESRRVLKTENCGLGERDRGGSTGNHRTQEGLSLWKNKRQGLTLEAGDWRDHTQKAPS